MSAFVCSPEHFITIADFAVNGNLYDNAPVSIAWLRACCEEKGIKCDNPLQTVASILYAENVRSVNYRYREDSAPDPSYLNGQHKVGTKDPVAILKMLACLEYQSCETPDYEQSLAYTILRAIRAGTIRRLPGFDDAPWAYDAGHTHSVETV